MSKKSKNAITIVQLELACRHVKEMIDAGVTENLAIRTLELFADMYAKVNTGGTASPHHVGQVDLSQWSVEARKVQEANRDAIPREHFRVEHGTPRRGFARKVLDLYENGNLNEEAMHELVEQYWKLAVITLEEDRRLNQIARSKVFDTPQKRWAAAGIEF